MDKGYRELSREELSVVLDALHYYCKSRQSRKEKLLKMKEEYTEILDHCVIMAQLDERVAVVRDRQLELTNLVEKKVEIFEEFDLMAYRLYLELLSYLESTKK